MVAVWKFGDVVFPQSAKWKGYDLDTCVFVEPDVTKKDLF